MTFANDKSVRRDVDGFYGAMNPTLPMHVANKQYVDSLISTQTANVSALSARVSTLETVTVIPAGTNLNSMTTTGNYYCNANANATLALNFPVAGQAGLLEVFGATSQFTWQRYTLFHPNIPGVYERTNYNGTWGRWITVASDTDWVTSGFTVGAGASSIGAGAIRRVGDVVSIALNTIAITSSINANIYGDVVNTVVAKVPSGFEPARDQVLGAYGTGALAAFYVNSAGNILISAVSPNPTWTNATTNAWTGTVGCGGTYFVN